MGKISERAWQNSVFISALYVGMGTTAVLCSYPPYYGDWVPWILLITLPVSGLSFGIMFAGKNNYLLVICLQIIVFLIFWHTLYKYFLKKYEKNESDIDKPTR